MSFYRSVFAAIAAVAIASPVFADDAATTTTTDSTPAAVQPDTSATSAAATTTTTTTTATDNTAATTTVDLNKASAKDLMKVKGINASKARAIVAYRKKHGDFKTTADISKVKGFTKLKSDSIQAIEGQLTVN